MPSGLPNTKSSSSTYGAPNTCPHCETFLFTQAPGGQTNGVTRTSATQNETAPHDPTDADQGRPTSTHYYSQQSSNRHRNNSSHTHNRTGEYCPRCPRILECRLGILQFEHQFTLSGGQQSPQRPNTPLALELSAESLSRVDETRNYSIERLLEESEGNNLLGKVEGYKAA